MERKRAVPNEGPWGKLPGVQVSSPEGLCPPKASFFLLNKPSKSKFFVLLFEFIIIITGGFH